MQQYFRALEKINEMYEDVKTFDIAYQGIVYACVYDSNVSLEQAKKIYEEWKKMHIAKITRH